MQCGWCFPQYDEALHGYMDAGGSLYEAHSHRSLQGMPHAHHSPHVGNHAPAMHPFHGNHVSSAQVPNHVMAGGVPDVHKRDKDSIYG